MALDGMAVGAGALNLAGSGLTAGLQAREAAKNRRFQKKMYRHRYQYSVKDMRKAGLNPILAAGAGLGGGSSPSGSMANMPDFGGAGDTMVRAKSVKSETGKRSQEVLNLKKQNQLLDVQIAGARAGVGETNARTQSLLARTLLDVNSQHRWQPFADIGKIIHDALTGPAKGAVHEFKTNENVKKNLFNMGEAGFNYLRDNSYPNNAKAVEAWLRERGLLNRKWSDN